MSSPSNNKNSPSNDEEREVSLEPAASPSVPESDRRSVSPAKRGDDQSPPPRAAARGHDDRRESSPRSVGASPPRRYNTDDLDRNGRQQGSDRDRPLEPRDTARYSPRPADSDRDRPYRSEGGRFSGRGPPPRSREEGFSLFVKNVHPSVQAGELRELFERHGPVQDVYIPKDHYSRQPKGFAYVQLERFDDAQNAIAKLDRTLLAGQELSVEEAKGRRKSRDEMRSLDDADLLQEEDTAVVDVLHKEKGTTMIASTDAVNILLVADMAVHHVRDVSTLLAEDMAHPRFVRTLLLLLLAVVAVEEDTPRSHHTRIEAEEATLRDIDEALHQEITPTPREEDLTRLQDLHLVAIPLLHAVNFWESKLTVALL
eukprot:CAMPEP_0117446430 /NCGR_PEP_ID=MMETSP0759-20121206/6337_1 /TAXON_ID=63605 /ORGANISM="Percolomonas cosmopolitus, Strain WS" /LENGTH=370 /DNA_ID=CAMNT_0005238697 /DNA_START=174 /DNA_END=1287 /DNA_ORIENTATION=+